MTTTIATAALTVTILAAAAPAAAQWLVPYPEPRISRPWPGTALRGLGPGGRARHLPSPAPALAGRRIRGGCPRARTARRGDRGTAVYGGNAPQRGERALRWADVVDSTAGDGMLVTVRRSKTNPEGEVNDVRFVKDGVARARRTLRAATSPEPGDRVVPLSAQMVGLRFTAAALAAGVESRVTAHSGRVGLASELTSRGASTTDVMLAGNWKTSRMVAHYSAGATAERGAVARYL